MKRILVFCVAAAVALCGAETPQDPAKTTLGQVTADLAKTSKDHPRLFATEQEFAAVRELVKKDEILGKAFARLRREADVACTAKPLVHKLTGFRLLGTARDCLKRTLNCAMMYRLSGEEKYKVGALKSVHEVLAFPDWNPKHFLDVSEFSLAVAIAYDWLYNDIDAEERSRIEAGLVKLGIEPSFTGKNWWIGGKSNWMAPLHLSPFSPPDCDRRVDSPSLSARGSRPSGRTSGPSLIFADCIELLHLWLQRI